MNLHIGFLSHVIVCNVTPLLDPACEAGKLLLFGYRDQSEHAEDIARLLQSRGLACEFVGLPDAHYTTIRRVLQERLAQIDQAQGLHDPATGLPRVYLNASGADVACTLAASEIFRQYGLPIFYVEPERDLLISVLPDGPAPRDLPNRLKIPDFLRIYGSRVEAPLHREPLADDLRTLCLDWTRLASRSPEALRRMNQLAYEAGNAERQRPLTQADLTDPDLQGMIDGLMAQGYARVHHGRLVFRNEAARSFANGLWLEHWVYSELFGLRQRLREIQDLAMGVEVVREVAGEAVRNEFDVLILAGNRLFLIECKTKQMRSDNRGTEAIYKLEALTELMGGVPARAAICSFLPISEGDRLRAHDLSIEVIDTRLEQVGSRIERWIRSELHLHEVHRTGQDDHQESHMRN